MITNRQFILVFLILITTGHYASLKSNFATADRESQLEKLFALQYNQEAIFKCVHATIRMLATQEGLSHDNTEKIVEIANKIFEKYLIVLKEEIFGFYLEHFDSTEINTIIAYHESPLGKKLFSKQEELTASSQRATVKFQQIIAEEARLELNKIRP